MHAAVTLVRLYLDGDFTMSWVWVFTSRSVNVARGKV